MDTFVNGVVADDMLNGSRARITVEWEVGPEPEPQIRIGAMSISRSGPTAFDIQLTPGDALHLARQIDTAAKNCIEQQVRTAHH